MLEVAALLYGRSESSFYPLAVQTLKDRAVSWEAAGREDGARLVPHTEPLYAAWEQIVSDMAAFEAVERLQKFDWLIQKLHSLRSTLHSEQGLQELQKLHALQLLQRNGLQFHSSIGESEDEKMEEKTDGDEEEAEFEEEEIIEEIEEDTEVMDDDDDDGEESGDADRSRARSTTPTSESMIPLQSCIPELEPAPPTTPSPASPPCPAPQLQPDSEGGGAEPPDTPPRYARFRTGLFPPLPFDAMLEESELKVGISLKDDLLASTHTSARTKQQYIGYLKVVRC